MKTLADLKRLMVVGSRWHLVDTGGWEPGVRAVGLVQSNCFAFVVFKDDKRQLSYCDFPKRSEVTPGDRMFTIHKDGHNRGLTYTREDKYLELKAELQAEKVQP